MGLFLSAQVTELINLQKHVAAADQQTKLAQMVRDHDKRGKSSFHHTRWSMANVFIALVLPHITNCVTGV